jgi:hypothetical protein
MKTPTWCNKHKYIFHLVLLSTCFGWYIIHHQEFQEYTCQKWYSCSPNMPGDTDTQWHQTFSHYVCYPISTRAIFWRARLLTHIPLLTDDSVSPGIFHKQLYHIWHVQSWNSWWWMMYHPKHVESSTKWNIYLVFCIKLVFSFTSV